MSNAKVPESWGSYFCQIDEHIASVRLNLALGSITPIEEMPHFNWFSVKFNDPDENGFTTRAEFPMICDIEDVAVAAFEKLEAIHVMAVKSQGTLDLYLYSAETIDTEALIEPIMEMFPDYSFAGSSDKDANWDNFMGLYPDAEELQGIHNQQVVISLQEQGDDMDVEREVDHWIYFKENDNMHAFLAASIDLGYRVISNKHDPERDLPYVANVGRMDNVYPPNVNTYVWELVLLAIEHEGDYDGWGCPVQKPSSD